MTEQEQYELEDSLEYAIEVILGTEEVLSNDYLGARTRIKTVLKANNMFLRDMQRLGYISGSEQ